MTFWRENKSNPTRKFRFRILSDDGSWYWAKSVNKPSFEIQQQEYTLINHKFKYPGVLTWNDVNIVMVDPGGLTSKIDQFLASHGYSKPSKNKTAISKNGYNGSGGQLQIQQLSSEGKIIEDWSLFNSFIKTVNYGELDYSDDNLVQIEMTISYDYATLNDSTSGGSPPVNPETPEDDRTG